MNIYKTTIDYLRIIDEIEEQGGEIYPEQEAEIVAISGTGDGSAEWHCEMMRNAVADVDAIADEIKRLQKRKKSAERMEEWHKSRVNDWMQTIGEEKRTFGTFKVSYRNTKSVNVYDEQKVPQSFKVQSWTVSKTAIADAIKEGDEVPGAEIVEKKNIIIR